ncbi:hypothetical protein CMO83_04845 [Candidatus Woesearchaeota archaeon]|jgi:hypothetical protein|nr:hypothetical protein [Candidatus Woesearchaeota archaeon]MDP6648206.1 hypothetical protein [Candidatus Woesearchaeota archaeon]|tara:strand:+ start:37787 stop:38563 length:777 start_codon:yes stop_codon:yes gene_type:complete
MNNKKTILNRIESELLFALSKYVIPFVSKKIKTKKPSNLENIVNKPKINFKDIRELESLLLKNLNENVKVRKRARVISNDSFYSLRFRREKKDNEKNNENYSITVRYEENQIEDKLKVSVKKDGKEVYSSEINNKKGIRDKVAPYSIRITYEDNYFEERLSITYRQQLGKYRQQHIASKEDMTERVPLKWVNIHPESTMGGVLGFTYLGDHSMGRRADLTGSTARMVDIHESIHTPDEYETRVLTSWIMEKARGKYIK